MRNPPPAPKLQGLELFEVYEANGNLLLVTSDASDIKREEGDYIVRRPWATSAPAELWWPKHTQTAENCLQAGPGAWFSSGLECRVCPPLPLPTGPEGGDHEPGFKSGGVA